MVFYVYSPLWFSGFDSILEIFIICICFLISYYSFKSYKIFNILKFKYFSISFLLFGISYIFKIMSNLIFVIPKQETIKISLINLSFISYERLKYINDISFFIHKITLILSLIILFLIISKEEKIETIFVTCLFGIILSFLINSYLIFNFLIVLLTLFLFLMSYFKTKFINHKNNEYNEQKIKNKKNVKLNLFFLGLFLSYFNLFLAVGNINFYFIGEIILCFSFIYLFLKLLQIFKK